MTKPITPGEVSLDVSKPPQVVEAFNELIRELWDGHQAIILQSEAVTRIHNKTGWPRDHIYAKSDIGRSMLDVEPLYREAGWIVEYDKPAYNEDYEPRFTFKKGR